MDLEEALVINLIFNDLVEAEELEENPPRMIYERKNAFELSEKHFLKLFRLSKNVTTQLIAIINPHIPLGPTRAALDTETMVLVTLLFYGQGNYQADAGRNMFTAMTQGTVSKCIQHVTDILNREEIMRQFISFPNNLAELQQLRRRFQQKYDMPGVVGCIDGTHVAIVAPNENEHVYVNRKNFHSINVQLVCDEKLKILQVNARYPGSCHDSFIWGQSNLSTVMEQIHRNYENELFFLIGDSGYPLRPWLMKAFDEEPPRDSPEGRFNVKIRSVRSLIERCNGLLKNRFRCLIKQRMLYYSPEKAAKIVNACVILHNLCVANNVPLPEEDMPLELENINIRIEEDPNPLGRVNPDLVRGRAIRNDIVNRYFQN